MEEQKDQYSDWVEFARKYGDPVNHTTDKHYSIFLHQESVPIIFVPGIMGTRLSDPSGKVVWNPNSDLDMLLNFGIRHPETESKNVVGKEMHVVKVVEEDPGYINQLATRIQFQAPFWDWIPFEDSAHFTACAIPPYARGQKIAKYLVDQGWGQIADDFYTDFLISISNPNTFVADGQPKLNGYNKIFQCPVYVHGYDWTKDNKCAGRLLAQFITDVIDREQGQLNRLCKKVILITHSMGGLVTRSALQQFPGLAASKVLGVIHGAQPVNGAPVCYRRIRGGFEQEAGITGVIMGQSYQFILPILGMCVGGLELLPSKKYRDDTGSAQWLESYDGAKKRAAGPVGDVYSDVYSNQDPYDFYRLVVHPEGLVPGVSKKERTGRQLKAMKDLCDNLGDAETFHESLSPDQGIPFQHPQSYHMYSKGMPTLDKVRWSFYRNHDAMHDVLVDMDGAQMSKPMGDEPLVGGVDFDPNYNSDHGGAYFKMNGTNPQILNGDGTVPQSSGSALLPGIDSLGVTGKVEHGTFYKSPDVIKFTGYSLMCLLEKHKQARWKGEADPPKPKTPDPSTALSGNCIKKR